jgi:hypothetical protein
MGGIRYTVLLSAVTIVFAAFIGTYWVKAQSGGMAATVTSESNGRNERSTPTSFILPATPAVAVEEELRLRQHLDKGEDEMLSGCAARLEVMGYDVGDEMVSFNAKLVEAIYLYQEKQSLAASGRLNGETRRSLKC